FGDDLWGERELACVLEGQSQLTDSLAGTQTESQTSPCVRVYENLNFKRFKGAVVNGVIVYTRERRSRINGRNAFSDDAEINGLKSSDELRLDESPSPQGSERGESVEFVVKDEPNCKLEMRRCSGYGPYSELSGPSVEEHDMEADLVEVEVKDEPSCNEGETDLQGRPLRRFTRSALRPTFEPTVESASGAVPVEVISNIEEDDTFGVSTLASPLRNKLELKMSKKIVLDRKPTTVKELFETGMVDGVQAFGLRGIIKDGGILCSCILCNNCRVIPPSQFEIHACKTYRRAAQYICFENGRSLLDLLKACRNASLHTLETTVQNFINSSPAEKYFTCKNCSVSFPPYCALDDGSLCYSCMESKKPECSPTHEPGDSLRSLMPVSISKSLKSAIPKSPKTGITKSPRIGITKSPRIGITKSSRIGISKSPRIAISKSPKSAIIKPLKSAISKTLKNAISKSPKSAPVCLSLQKKRKSSPPVLLSDPSGSASPMCSPYKSRWKITPKSSKSILISRSPSPASMYFSSQKKSQWRITTKDQRLHKLVFEEDGLPDGTEVAYYARGQKLLVGYKMGFGIFCRCCNSEVSPSQFEAHAGWASRRKPYAYIYTSNGVSLHELAISLSRGRKYSSKDNDDLCIICADGGNLVLCDGCPRAFHRDCASLPNVPRGDWYCKFCQSMFQREKFVEHNENAVAAGRISGIDPIEQITQRCIRIVKDIEAELTGCVLCRGYDFSKSGFGPRTIILCDQLLTRGAEKLPDSHLDVIKKKQEGNGLETVSGLDVRWRLISGKIASQESRLLLAQAVAIFHDCFDPIIDSESGRDLIPAMVYGSTVVSAGIIRVFGHEVAELPLVATSNGNHGKGYFQLLFSCIEKLLAFLSVKSLVLPAAEEAESIWTEKFGFTKIMPDQSDFGINW
ncbi:Acyl-CoA N-acyltransferase with RING/FYVE/PHD-type zinc finger domain, partial [Prunus dulcis]